MGLADEREVDHEHDGTQSGDGQKGRSPSELMVKGSAEQRRKAGRGCHGNHHEGKHPGECIAREEIEGDGTCQGVSRTHAEGLNDTPSDQHRKVRGERTQ